MGARLCGLLGERRINAKICAFIVFSSTLNLAFRQGEGRSVAWGLQKSNCAIMLLDTEGVAGSHNLLIFWQVKPVAIGV